MYFQYCANRIHEILARDKNTFDPTSTLLARYVELKTKREGGQDTEYLTVHLKSPKEQKLAKGVTVELFPTENFTCPIKAYKKWRDGSKLIRNNKSYRSRPLVRMESGENFTGKKLNKVLKKLLSPYVDYSKGKVTSHSYRAGLATMMAKCGYSDADIMTTGEF